MGKDSPDPPPAPNPAATARAQAAANKETAIAESVLGNVNQVTPYGNVTYRQLGEIQGVPRWQQTTTLTPEAQRAFDTQQGLTADLYGLGRDQFGRVGDVMSQPFSFGGMPGGDYTSAPEERRRIEDALYGSMTSRLDPRFDAQERRMDVNLANQGFVPGTEAYQTAKADFGRTKNDAYQQALSQAIASGGAEMSRDFGMDQAARQQAISEASYLRNLPLNEISALLGTGQVQGPQAQAYNAPNIAAPDITGLTMAKYQGDLNQYNQEMNQQNALMGSLFGLGGALGGGWLSSLGNKGK